MLTIEASSSSPLERIHEHEEDEPKIYDVTDGLKSKYTAKAYAGAFNHFLEVAIKSQDLRVLLNTKQNVIESKIIDHITYLKDVEGLTYRSILVHLSAIFHFFEINDYDDLKRRKIKRFLPEDESEHYAAADRAYSITEIDQILRNCDIRDKVAVLVMTSSGPRIGGLRELQLGDIKKMDEFGIYLIRVYNRSGKDRYYTFCSQECAAAIDEYLSYRQKCGEQLKDKSPLIRDKFSVDNPFTAQVPRFLSIRSMSLLFEEVLKRAKINPIIPGHKKRAVACSHGFRKFFITQCDRSGMSFTTREYLSGHRLPNQDPSYIRTTEEDRLAEYVKAIPLLTIDPTQRLRQENQELRKDYLAELGDLRAEFNEMKELLVHMSKDNQKKIIDESLQKARYEAEIDWSCD
jgi:integrase